MNDVEHKFHDALKRQNTRGEWFKINANDVHKVLDFYGWELCSVV